jgi:hypothetical protein
MLGLCPTGKKRLQTQAWYKGACAMPIAAGKSFEIAGVYYRVIKAPRQIIAAQMFTPVPATGIS